MKKFFSLFAALFVALAMNAAIVNITPGGAVDIRHAVRDHANAGDTVVLADGEYTQGGDYTYFDKNIVMMAAENAHPVVKFTVPAQIKSGARAEIKGIKFDMTNLHGQSWYEHLFYASDATDGNCLIFDGCEFYNDTLNNSVLFCGSSYKLDSLIVKNCIFHDILKSCIFIENSSATKGVIIENSTFYRITTNTASYWAGIIDVRSTIAKVRVDHCTFYDCIPMNTDYGCIGKVASTDAVVSNSIFALPTSTDAVRCIRMDGGNANNCLMFNYLYDSGYGVRSAVTKSNCVKEQNPLFANAAAGDFTLGTGSPALTAATDGGAIGDLRWAPAVAPIEPEYRTIYCKIESDWWKYDANGQPVNTVGAYAWGQGIAELAAWPGVKMDAVEGEANVWSISLDTRYANIVFTRVGPSGNYEGIKTPDLVIPADSNAMYTISAPTPDWSSPNHEMLAESDGAWSTYAPYEPALENGYYLMGIVGGDSTATWTIADLNSSRKLEVNQANTAEYQISVTLAVGDQLQVVEVANDAITNWFPGGEGMNFVIDAAHAGEKTIYFRPDRQGASDWWQGCIYIAPNSSSAIDALGADAKAVKVIENGRIYIIRDGVRFNILGAQE